LKKNTTLPDRKNAPAIVDAVNFNLRLKQAEIFSLSNGVEVYAINAGAEEVMSVECVFFAGNWFESQNLVAATANFLLRNGTTSRSAFQINEHFEYYGSYMNRACYNETAAVTLHCLNKHIDELLPVVRELITDSVMPEDELAIYSQNMKQRLKVNLRKSDFIAGRLIDTYLYGEDHPYGRYSKMEDFDALKRETLLSFYDQYYRQGKMIIFVAGKLPGNLEMKMEKYFGDLSNEKIIPTPIITQPAAEKK
jgi:zinc protease